MAELDLDELERQVGSWAEENFPDQPPSYPLIGAGEEQGECTRSILKRLQGIDDSEKYADRDDVGAEAERDAVGDVMIYLADYFNRKDEASFGSVDVVTFSGDEVCEDEAFEDLDDRRSSLVSDKLEDRRSSSFEDRYDRADEAVLDLYSKFGALCRAERMAQADVTGPSSVEQAATEFVCTLGDFCEFRGYDLAECVADAWDEVSDREWDSDITHA